MRRALLTLVFAACGAPAPQPDAGCATTLELGTATDDTPFVALADGDALVMHAGPQGGFHVYGAARATGLEARGLLIFELRQNGASLARQSLDLSAVQLEPRACGWERSRTALFLLPPDVTPLRDTVATLHVVAAGHDVERQVRLE